MRILVVPISLFLFSAAANGQKMTLETFDRQAEPTIDAATAETARSVEQLVLPEGLEASLWAAEPMLANPVAFAFDEQGRAFISETHRYRTSVLDIRGYMEMLERDLASRTVDDRAELIKELFGDQADDFAIEGEIVRLLEDRDGDGQADFSAVYADGFNTPLDGIASGVLARKGEVYFTNIPHLWKFQGIDSEGRAESQESLLRGFGVHFGFTGHDFHGLIAGPDGKLYYSIGDRGVSVPTKEGGVVHYPDTGAVFRSDFDGSNLEIVHWGLRNPQELAFNEYGDLFTGDNDCDQGDFERMVQVVEGGDSGWTIGHQTAPKGSGGVWMSEGWWELRHDEQPLFLLPPLSYIEDGPSGIAYYPGTGLSPEYQGHLFITHFKGTIATSGVFAYTFDADGASYSVTKKEQFLKGVLPTDVTFAPDGRFYVLDWVDGWPKSNKGRIYAIEHPETQSSPIVEQTKQLIGEGMEQRADVDLVGLLAHPNWNVRLEAQFELAGRGESSAELFATVGGNESAELFARLHAVWGLGQLTGKGSETARSVLRSLGRADEPEVRAQAIKLIGDHRIEEEYSLLIEALEDPSSRTRYFAAQSLGKLGRPEAASALLELARANNDQDTYLRHAVVMGLAGTANSEVLARATEDPDRAVRAVALLAYRRLNHPNVAAFLDDEDLMLAREAARAINDEPVEAAIAELAKSIEGDLADDPVLAPRALNANFRIGGDENAVTLARYAATENFKEEHRLEAVRHLATWGEPPPRDRILGVYRPLPERSPTAAAEALAQVASQILEGENGAVQAETIATLIALGARLDAEQLKMLVLDETKDGRARVAAFNALKDRDEPDFDALITQAGRSSSAELRMATLPLVAERSPAEAEVVLELMVQGTADEQRAAYEALAQTQQPFAARVLAESLARLAAGEIPFAAQLELLEATEEHADPEVQAAFASYQKSVAEESDPVAPYRFALEGGSSQMGYRVYNNNPIMSCVRCHIANGPGDAAGPNLSDAGLRLDRHYLLESIVAPNAKMAAGFDNVIVTLKNGTTQVGTVAEDGPTALSLKMPDGSIETIAKSEIERRESLPSSMPDIYRTILSREELRDVVEFLATRLEDPAARSTHGN